MLIICEWLSYLHRCRGIWLANETPLYRSRGDCLYLFLGDIMRGFLGIFPLLCFLTDTASLHFFMRSCSLDLFIWRSLGKVTRHYMNHGRLVGVASTFSAKKAFTSAPSKRITAK